MHNRLRVLTILLVAAAIWGCSGSDGDGNPDLGMMGNRAPTARIDASRLKIPVNDNHATVVRLDSSGSTDPEGDPLSYTWNVPGGTFVEGTGPDDPAIAVTFPGVAPYTVTLTVDDGTAGIGTASVEIVPGRPNDPDYP